MSTKDDKILVVIEGESDRKIFETIRQRIKLKAPPSKDPDELTQGEERQYIRARQQAELARMKAVTDGLIAKTDGHIAMTALQVFFIKCIIPSILFLGLVAIFGIIIWQSIISPQQRLSDKILVAMINMGIASIIGSVTIVVIKQLFPKIQKQKNKNG